MSLMGVDIGSTGVKAAVFSESGQLLAQAYEEYPLFVPFSGACELDSRVVMDAACRVIGMTAGDTRGGDPVRTIGIASQGEAFTPVAADGRMLSNAMISSDRRAQSQVSRWSDAFGTRRLYNITGHTSYPMYSMFKMLWLKENRPDVWQETWRFLFFEDLLAFVLTGEAATDYSLASCSMLFDVSRKSWSDEILDFIGLDIERLPRVVQSGAIAGNLTQEMAGKLGLDRATTVSVCGHDQPVGAVGCGAAVAGRASYSMGTVECACLAVDHLILNDELMRCNLSTYPHTVADTYTTVAFNNTGGSVLRWVRDNFAVEETAQARQAGVDPYERIIASASERPSNLVLLPHFGPTGTPHFDPYGTGVLFGLNLSTSRAEILRAVLEGITYEMRWNLATLADAGLQLSELRAVGGGAKSEAWMQIRADILSVPLTTMQVSEGTCMGAAILAGDGAGILEAKAASGAWAVPISTFEPRSEFAAACEDRFALYKELYQSLGKSRRLLDSMKGNGL